MVVLSMCDGACRRTSRQLTAVNRRTDRSPRSYRGCTRASASARERASSSTDTMAAVHAGERRGACTTIRVARDSLLAPRVSKRRARRILVAASASLTRAIARPKSRTNARGISWHAHSGRTRPERSSHTSPAIVPGRQLASVVLVELLVGDAVDVLEAPGVVDVVLVDVVIIVVELVGVVVVVVAVGWVPVVEEVVVLLAGVDVLDVVVVGT